METDSLSKIAKARLYPSITDPNYLVLRARRLIFSKWARELQGEHLNVLDLGGRYQPYRPLLDGRIAHYVGVDLIKTEFVDVVADGEELPFAPESFDLAIATQVFDCFENPEAAAKNIWVALKPGGILLASFPAFVPQFASAERWRFTRAGIQTLLAPFPMVEIIPELRSAGGLFRTINLALERFVHYPIARAIYRMTVCPMLNVLGLLAEELNLTSNDQFTPNYSVRAEKPGVQNSKV